MHTLVPTSQNKSDEYPHQRHRIAGRAKKYGPSRGVKKSKPTSAYRVGDRVGIFCLLYLTENAIILGDSDKHLDVKVFVYKTSQGKHPAVAVSNVAHIPNTLGRVHMFFVAPMHKIIAPAMLANSA